MRRLLSILFTIVFICFFTCCKKAEILSANYNVIPRPNSFRTMSGDPFLLGVDTKIVFPAGNRALKETAYLLSEYLYQSTGYGLKVISDRDEIPLQSIVLSLAEGKKNPEGYRLDIRKERINITAITEAGVFYGIQTLRKSIPAKAYGATIQLSPIVIDDAPRFPYRGVHLDAARHMFSVDFIKQYIDILALHHVNHFHWHLTDDQGWRIEIRKYPNLTKIGAMRAQTVLKKDSVYDGKQYGGYYTQDEITEIVEYAAHRFITVIPEIDIPGHTLAALAAYPQFGCTGGPYEVATEWGVFEDVICAGNEEAMLFLEDVLSEVMELFPSQFIHVGGDQCLKNRWQNCSKCQARIKKENLAANKKHSPEENLQSYVIRRMEKHLNAQGRYLIGWEEVLQGGLAPNATVMAWRSESRAIEAAQMGHSVIMAPLQSLYFDTYQEKNPQKEILTARRAIDLPKVYGYEPIPANLPHEWQHYVIGCQANLWTEYMTSPARVEYMLMPRIAALAEIQWTQPEKKDYNDFLNRLPRLLEIYDREKYNYATPLPTSL